jgi:hypothetical protein
MSGARPLCQREEMNPPGSSNTHVLSPEAIQTMATRRCACPRTTCTTATSAPSTRRRPPIRILIPSRSPRPYRLRCRFCWPASAPASSAAAAQQRRLIADHKFRESNLFPGDTRSQVTVCVTRFVLGSSRKWGNGWIRIPALRVGGLTLWATSVRAVPHAPMHRPVPQANASLSHQAGGRNAKDFPRTIASGVPLLRWSPRFCDEPLFLEGRWQGDAP